VYLLDGKTCIEKQRTRTTRRTLDPLIQQTLIFKENFREKVLQVNKNRFFNFPYQQNFIQIDQYLG
jgi:hypothetical protein